MIDSFYKESKRDPLKQVWTQASLKKLFLLDCFSIKDVHISSAAYLAA